MMLSIRNFIASLLPGTRVINGASHEAPSISVFHGPESRSGRTPFLGGRECNDFKKVPVNILVRWSDDESVSWDKAKEVYDALVDRVNLTFESTKFAYFSLLDDGPVWIGRGDKNIVEYTIRVDVYYYT